MTRLITLLVLVTLFSLGIAWLAESPGWVTIEWGVYRVEAPMLALVAGTAFFALACILLYWIMFSLLRAPRLWSQSRVVKRQSLGITALTETFAAIASQDVRGARKYLKRAESLLPDQPLTLMLASQVARLEGNEGQSLLYLERMSKTGVTEFLALRGLIENARLAGDNATALRHAEKAYDMKPHDHWLATTLIGLYATENRPQDALRTLDRAARKRAIHSDEVHQIRAALLCAEAQKLLEARQYESAIARLREALRRHPRFVPAITLLADVYNEKADVSMALKVAGDGWKRLPHAEIAEVLLRCFDGAKDKHKAAKVLRKLAKYHADHEEAQVLMAGLAAREGDNRSACAILKQLLQQSGETARLCVLLAQVEHLAENHDQEAYWHRRAKESPAGSVWECRECKRPADTWELACPQCGTLGSLL